MLNKETKVAQHLINRVPQLRISISNGNKKMGHIKSISLPPIKSFYTGERICIKCDCNTDCYAFCNIYRRQKQPAAAYEDNYYTLKNDPDLFWRTVEEAIMTSRSFRWHVSGEILNMDYLNHMVDIAKRNSHCEMLCFTKKFPLVNLWIKKNGNIPDNLHIIFSAWKGLKMCNPYHLPECHIIYKDGSTTASEEKTSYICSGNCTECFCKNKLCFALKKNEQILIHQH